MLINFIVMNIVCYLMIWSGCERASRDLVILEITEVPAGWLRWLSTSQQKGSFWISYINFPEVVFPRIWIAVITYFTQEPVNKTTLRVTN